MNPKIAQKGEVFGNYTCVSSDFELKLDGTYHAITQRFLCKCGTEKVLVTKYLRYLVKHNKPALCMSCSRKKRYETDEKVKIAFKNRRERGRSGLISGTFFSHIKQCAKNRKIFFNLTVEYVWQLAEKQDFKCAISGVKLKFTLDRKNSDHDFENSSASLDRIDSKLGYEEGNVQWVHKRINNMKYNFSNADFISICKAIAVLYGNTEPSQENNIESILEGVTHRG